MRKHKNQILWSLAELLEGAPGSFQDGGAGVAKEAAGCGEEVLSGQRGWMAEKSNEGEVNWILVWLFLMSTRWEGGEPVSQGLSEYSVCLVCERDEKEMKYVRAYES